MLISHNGWRAPESNRDIFVVLAEHGVLPSPPVESFAKTAGLQNSLVHEYTRIDPGVVMRPEGGNPRVVEGDSAIDGEQHQRQSNIEECTT